MLSEYGIGFLNGGELLINEDAQGRARCLSSCALEMGVFLARAPSPQTILTSVLLCFLSVSLSLVCTY